MFRMLGAAVAALCLLSASAASAATAFNFQGIISSGVDTDGVFGDAGASLVGQTFTVRVVIHDDNIRSEQESPPMFTFLASDRSSVHYAINGVGVGLTGLTYPNPGFSEGRASGSNGTGGQVVGYIDTARAMSSVTAQFSSGDQFFTRIWDNIPLTSVLGSFTASYATKGEDAKVVKFTAAGPMTIWADRVTAVPEPSTWTMMIAGFGLAGAALRRRQLATTRNTSSASYQKAANSVALTATVLLLSALASPAAAGQYGFLAEFEAIGTNPNFRWTSHPGYKAGGQYSSVGTPGEANTLFTFRTPGVPVGQYPQEMEALFALNALGPLLASMTITGDTPGWGGNCAQPCALATISFTYAGQNPITVDGKTFLTGANLLTMGPADNSPPTTDRWNNYYWSSDFIDLGRLTSVLGYGQFQFDSLPPIVTRDGGPAVDDFVGRFASGYFYAGVPEPTTWVMLIVGFGLAGVGVRRARKVQSTFLH